MFRWTRSINRHKMYQISKYNHEAANLMEHLEALYILPFVPALHRVFFQDGENSSFPNSEQKSNNNSSDDGDGDGDVDRGGGHEQQTTIFWQLARSLAPFPSLLTFYGGRFWEEMMASPQSPVPPAPLSLPRSLARSNLVD